MGASLLKNGKLRNRVTMIPLNKITPRHIKPEIVAAAKRIAPGKVDLALNLVSSDPSVSKAMKFVFGSTLIAKDIQSAKAVTFDRSVNLKSVTLEGDIYDPSGQLSGGSKSASGGMLAKMQQIKKLSIKLRILESELSQIRAQLEQISSVNKYYFELTRNHETEEHKVQLLETRMMNNPHYKIVQNVEQIKKDLKEVEKVAEDAKARQIVALERIKFIQKEMHELTHNRDDKLKALKVRVD